MMSIPTFLVVGAEGAGKSMLMKRIRYVCKKEEMSNACEIMPTIGVDLEEYRFRKSHFQLREVGGNFLQLWANFIRDSVGIVYLVDVSDAPSLSASCIEFYNLMINEDTREIPVFLVLNKIDCSGTFSKVVFEEAFRLHELREVKPNIKIVEVSAEEGTNVIKLLEELTKTICKR